MAESTLVAENKEAGRKFLAELIKVVPVDVAFWLKDADGRMLLYVASQQITDEKVHSTYMQVHQIARRLRDPWFESFDVRVINSSHPLAVAALQLQSRYGPDVPRRVADTSFGGMSVEEVYIYPTPVPAS
ncbi:MAG TPA: hypothetical protein VFW87_21475 [Pirellulales bacterium]|nr:hypothetical protein [Pirellulales bacterium]